MADIQKQIANLKKQNEGMEKSFQSKGIQFTKHDIITNEDPNEELSLIKSYNDYLKSISAANRPPAPIKEDKKEDNKIKEPKKEKKSEEEDEDELTKEIKPIFSTITNMEDIKRSFFSKEYDAAYELIKEYPFKFYKGNYYYSSDNNGKPNYIAKNLLRGFVQGLDDYRKYLMVCFRCIIVNKDLNEYKYPSYWIVNSNDDLKTILGPIYEDFYFIEVKEEEAIKKMLKRMEKESDDNDVVIGEVYVH